MAPEIFGWIVLGTLAGTLLTLTIREEFLRHAGK
jgi:hypothetical protein